MYEILEARLALSVTVVGYGGGHYDVFGTDGPDNLVVQVEQATGDLTIDDGTSPAPYWWPDATVVNVYGRAGDDCIWVGTYGDNQGRKVYADGMTGNDYLELYNEGAIFGNLGNDMLYIRGQGNYPEATGGPGSDYIAIDGSPVMPIIYGDDNDGGDDLGDFIDASGSTVSGVVVWGGQGNDTIYGSIYGDQLYGGEGTDQIYGYGGNDVIV